jgi:predicted Zn-dependent protease
MSDTPETDAAADWYLAAAYSTDPEDRTVPLAVSRKLERERDEARAELHDIRLNLGDDAEGYTLLHAVCALQNERDEAREQRDSLQALSQSLAETCVKLKTERDEWAKLCGQYKQERDEARVKP